MTRSASDLVMASERATPRGAMPPLNAPQWNTPVFGREDVIVADDGPHMRRLLGAALRQFGFVPIDSVNLHEGSERGASAARIDVELTDLVLPEVSGTEMVRRWSLKQPRLKAVCLKANASALFDAHVPTPFSLKGLCDALASLHHADITRRDLRRWYSMALDGASDHLRAEAWDLFTQLAPPDAEMNRMNAVVLVFAELPRDGPLDQEMRGRRDTPSVDDARRLTRSWQFARLEQR